MIRIFVTGDNHIGLKYSGHEKGAQLAESRIKAFNGMVDAANREGCGLFVITGDLFENNYSIVKKDIKALLDILANFKGTVAILPGNHDYYDADAKLWRYFAELAESFDNVLLLNSYRTYKLTVDESDVILYPALCTTLHSEAGQNNLGWINRHDITEDSAYHIGIAHGAVEGETIDSEGQYFLMKRSELESIPVDLWLIGHTHVPFPRNLTKEFTVSDKVLNAGTHVQTDVACNTEGQCFVVEINSEKTIKAKKFVSGDLRFYRRHITVKAGEMSSVINRELVDIANNSVVDVILKGAVTAEEYEDRFNIAENALSRFTESKCNYSDLSKLISAPLIACEFPETSLSAKLLTALLDEPKEAQLAYELLTILKGGKQ